MSAPDVSLEEAIPNPEVAAYYRDFPRQLDIDHPHLARSEGTWERLCDLAPQAHPHRTSMESEQKVIWDRAIEELERTGSWPEWAHVPFADFERQRQRRAGALGLPCSDGPYIPGDDLPEAIPDPEVAAYYSDFPAQLPLDHPHLERTAVWKRIAKLAPQAQTPPAPTQHVGTAAAARAIAQLQETGSLPADAQERATQPQGPRHRQGGTPGRD